MTDTLNLSHLIDGERADVSRPTESHNPSNTNEIVARTPDGGQAGIERGQRNGAP